MANDPYKSGMFKADPYWKKNPIKAKLTVVLDGQYEERGLELIQPPSRALLKNEIHELILTDEVEAGPGKTVNRIAYLGFMEIEEGGVMVAGDELWIDNQLVGKIAGFDVTHMPNHLNIIVKSETRKTGREYDFDLNNQVIVKK